MIIGAWISYAAYLPAFAPLLPFPVWQYALGGILVGFGAHVSNGCTSGHMICGVSRLSLRSIVASATFTSTAILVSNAAARNRSGQHAVAAFVPPDTGTLVAMCVTFGVAASLAVLLVVFSHPRGIKVIPTYALQKVSAVLVFCGAVIGIGLCFSGMSRPEQVLGFLNVGDVWNPTLAFVAGGAIVPKLILYFALIRRMDGPLIARQHAVAAFFPPDTGTLVAMCVTFGVAASLAVLLVVFSHPRGIKVIPTYALQKVSAVLVFCGAVIGIGLCFSGMSRPEQVLGFLNVGDVWNPTLAFVAGGAIVPKLILYFALIRRMDGPLIAKKFHTPTKDQQKRVTVRLVGGAGIFGAGWGLCGLCTGPALLNAAVLEPSALAFVLFMTLGMFVGRLLDPKHPLAPLLEKDQDLARLRRSNTIFRSPSVASIDAGGAGPPDHV
eukprot:tig00020902_g15064.t1